MGSSGSLFLGYSLAVIAIIGGAKIAAAIMVLGLPILDVAWVIVFRLSRRRSPFRGGDGAHLSHRLKALGFRSARWRWYSTPSAFSLACWRSRCRARRNCTGSPCSRW